MYFRQFYLGCLAHASYLIGSGGDAAVVDPQRDVELYLEEAEAQGFTIKHVIETHLHADFVSGHRELAARTGAQVYFGHRAFAKFAFVPVHDGEEIHLGHVTLRFLETPGHTPESISVVVFDNDASSTVPDAVLTGDALFIGDVGRPDLLGSRMPATDLAAMLYDSLHQKLLTLPDEVKVYPAHGAGSMCGRNISDAKTSTIGHERRFNYALQPMSREAFVKLMTTDLPEPPAYFSRDAQINLEGPVLLESLPALKPLASSEVERLRQSGALVLDTRPAPQYGNGHIPQSLHIGLAGQFASWAGSIVKLETAIVIVAEDEQNAEAARVRLARVGLENIVGYLDGGVLAWHNAGLPLASIEQISVEELKHRLDEKSIDLLIDVRRPGEWESGHISESVHLPLNKLSENLDSLNRENRVAAICAGGFRSSIATSILEQHGFRRISNIVGGMSAWNIQCESCH
jgi:glyoxylase-like metal-dependent hydrolase (beta-lactamase superfamily II)/rhodanese-related sulfurtransferase